MLEQVPARDALEREAWRLPFPEGAEPIGVTLRVAGGGTVADFPVGFGCRAITFAPVVR